MLFVVVVVFGGSGGSGGSGDGGGDGRVQWEVSFWLLFFFFVFFTSHCFLIDSKRILSSCFLLSFSLSLSLQAYLILVAMCTTNAQSMKTTRC